jgi:hypothetical protein
MHGEALSPRAGIFLDWGGDEFVPAWQGVRTPRFLYVRNADGFEELYRSGDILQLHNVARDPGAADMLARGRALLASFAAKTGG